MKDRSDDSSHNKRTLYQIRTESKHTHTHTQIHTYIHIHIHTYKHAYIHTYIMDFVIQRQTQKIRQMSLNTPVVGHEK